MKIEIELSQLKELLDQQKRITTESLAGQTSYYNLENTPGHQKSLPIDKELFLEAGMQSRYPSDYDVLTKYIKP